MTQVFKCRLAVRAHLVSHLSLRSANGGAQGFDDFAHALELTGMGVVALLLALLGGGLLEQVATGFSHLEHFGDGRFQQLCGWREFIMAILIISRTVKI